MVIGMPFVCAHFRPSNDDDRTDHPSIPPTQGAGAPCPAPTRTSMLFLYGIWFCLVPPLPRIKLFPLIEAHYGFMVALQTSDGVRPGGRPTMHTVQYICVSAWKGTQARNAVNCFMALMLNHTHTRARGGFESGGVSGRGSNLLLAFSFLLFTFTQKHFVVVKHNRIVYFNLECDYCVRLRFNFWFSMLDMAFRWIGLGWWLVVSVAFS